jgi:hypothetical protein
MGCRQRRLKSETREGYLGLSSNAGIFAAQSLADENDPSSSTRVDVRSR